MLVCNYRFFLLNVLIWSIFMLGIKIRMVLKSELGGLHENVQHFDPRCLESREIHKPKKATTLRDTLYIHIYGNNHILNDRADLSFRGT